MQNQKESMTPAEIGAHEARRRKLLRLGAAAPMVLTLRPGSSFGASIACTEKAQNAADAARAESAEKLAMSADADEWVRAQVDVLELYRTDFDTTKSSLDSGKIEGKYVLGTDGSTYWRVDSGSPGAGPMIASTQSTPRVSDGAGSALGKDSPSSTDSFNTSNVTARPVEKRWALIKVDPKTGDPLGYSWEPQALNGIAVSDGCFASMNVGAAQYRGVFGGPLGAYVKRVLGLG